MGSSRRDGLGQKNLNTLKGLLYFDNSQRRVLLREADKKTCYSHLRMWFKYFTW